MILLFAPKARYKHPTYKALLADLGIPHAQQLIDMARLQLFAHIATLQTNTPAGKIYNYWKQKSSSQIQNLPTYFCFQPLTHTLGRAGITQQWGAFTHTLPPHHVFPPKTIITTETLAETGLQNTLRKPKNPLDHLEQSPANTQIPQILEPREPRSHYAQTILSTIPFPGCNP
jgi:hypothetical protein